VTARRLQLGLAAAALWAAALPSGTRADAAGDAERQLGGLRSELQLMEQELGRRDESAGQRARHRFSEGEVHFRLGDWSHAATLLYEAVDEPEFRASADLPTALYYLGESLFQQGDLATARGYFRQVLEVPQARFRREALLRSLDAAVRLGTLSGLDALLAEAERTFAGSPPAELRYLAAKATWRRRDLAPAARTARALQAFAAVPAPFHVSAAYFRGAILVEAKDLPGAAQAFEECARLAPADAAQRQARELCLLGLGRVYTELGRHAEAIDRYQEIPRQSPHFEEALHEMAWTYVRAGRLQQALHTASLISDLSPESPLAPEATILQGHLQLRLGRYGEAVESYNRVVDRYAPVRDQVDAILGMHEDPVRYFDEIVGRGEKPVDASGVLPPVAVKWASTRAEVARALEVVADLDRGRRDLAQGQAIADRIDAVLSRNGGLDAFPRLKEGWARADAVGNGVVRLEGELAAAAEALVLAEKAVPPEPRAAVEQARAARLALEPRVRRLPRTGAEALERLAAIRERFAEVDRAAFRLGYDLESSRAALTGTQAWLDQHRDDSAGAAEGRAGILDQIRRHREVVAGYEEELKRQRQEVRLSADAVSGSGGAAGDAEVREAYRRAVARSWQALARAGGAVTGRDREQLGRMDRVRSGFPEVLARAARLQGALRGTAKGSVAGLQARVRAERERMARQLKDLGRVQEETRGVVGRIAYQSFRAVRQQFYQLVLKADVGLVDVAWQRKRDRVEKIQQLSTAKAADLSAMDEEFKDLLREVP
jgi:tetratricopeptide (TPR) repeat protein